MKISLFKILVILLAVNIAGGTLRFFELDRYFILIGFRFHLSLVIPFIFLINKITFDDIKSLLIPKNKFSILSITTVIFSVVAVTTSLYLLNYIDIGDPEYFYEFGLSSVFDYPVYLLWNIPQLFLLFLFLTILLEKRKYKFITGILIVTALFIYEFIPVEKTAINYYDLAIIVLSIIITNLLFLFYKNFYSISISLFTLLWGNFLLWGTDSKTVTNILYAARYNEWEGFFSVSKVLNNYIYFIIPFLTLLILSMSLFFIKKRS